MIISSDLPHKTRKEWQEIDKGLMRILDSLENIRPHSSTSMYAWMNSGKGYYKFREEVRAIR